MTAHLALSINLEDLARRYDVLRKSCADLRDVYKKYNATLIAKEHDDHLFMNTASNSSDWWGKSSVREDDRMTSLHVQVQLNDALSFCLARVSQARRSYRLTYRILLPGKERKSKSSKRLRSKREALTRKYYRYIKANLQNPSKHPKRFWTALGSIVSLVLTAYTQIEINELSNQVNGIARN